MIDDRLCDQITEAIDALPWTVVGKRQIAHAILPIVLAEIAKSEELANGLREGIQSALDVTERTEAENKRLRSHLAEHARPKHVPQHLIKGIADRSFKDGAKWMRERAVAALREVDTVEWEIARGHAGNDAANIIEFLDLPKGGA